MATRVCFVTGGAQGIGRGMVQAFLARGYAVTALDIDAEALAECAATAPRERFEAVAGDVADEAAVDAAVARALERFGRLDVLVNNAGVSQFRPLEQLTLAQWNRVLGVNLTGMFLCAKRAAPALRAAHGAIVNIASTRAFMSEPGSEAYAASKGGVVALTHALAASLAPDVRVNAIAPGWIDVSAWGKRGTRTPTVLSAADHAQHWSGRVGRPEDVAALAAWLASAEAGFITGQCFPVDGGMTKKMMDV